jgi:tetratricopeptide (TPR) repeat protein
MTALHFASAAATVAPESAEAANLAGLMYRRAGDWQRAEMYYPRAIALSRRHRDTTEYVCGHIGYAALLYSRGIALDKAVRHLNTAARVAADNGSFWLAGHALHDSMLLQVQRNEFAEAELQAARAAELYPLHDRRFPHFVVDFAFVQLEQRRFQTALALLQLCSIVIHEPAVQALIHGMMARGHGGLGSRDEYRRSRREAERLAEEFPEHACVVHYHLAEGARACHAWAEAERHARQSRALALKRGDREMVRLADGTLASVARRAGIEAASPEPGSRADQLARELIARLSRWNPQSHPIKRRRAFRDQWVA